MSSGRKIIVAQNVVMGALVTNAAVRWMYGGMHGIRLWLIILCMFLTITRLLTDAAWLFLKGARNDKAGKKADKRGIVPGIIWHKMRFRKSEPQDRDTAVYLTEV